MPSAIELIAERLPRVTMEDVRRFADIVEIRDPGAFAAELQMFVHERVESLALPSSMDPEALDQVLKGKSAALRVESSWVPTETDIQRGRAALLEVFRQPDNLPIAAFARLAHKSRQQIYKDIHARRLLVLSVGPRGQRLPDWQLDPVKQKLTEIVLQGSSGIDNWTVYRAMSEPLESLSGRSPVDVVTQASIQQMAATVFNVLGVHAD